MLVVEEKEERNINGETHMGFFMKHKNSNSSNNNNNNNNNNK